MQRFYNFVSLPLITGLLIAVSLSSAQAKPASEHYLASLPEGSAPSTTTLPGATRATHEENLNPSTDLRSLPNGSGSPNSGHRAGATRGGRDTRDGRATTTTASLLCRSDLTDTTIAPEFTSITMMPSTDEEANLSTASTAPSDTLNGPTAIALSNAVSNWQLYSVYQFSQSNTLCE